MGKEPASRTVHVLEEKTRCIVERARLAKRFPAWYMQTSRFAELLEQRPAARYETLP
jgi:hypothetical protein